MIDRNNILKVRSDIAASDPNVCNMGYWDCKTCACIGGFTVRRMLAEGIISERQASGIHFDEEQCAGTYLGLDVRQSYRLFYDFPVIEGGREPGIVDWKKFMLARLDDLLETGAVRNYIDIEALQPFVDQEIISRSKRISEEMNDSTD